jgi:hypothetical protein
MSCYQTGQSKLIHLASSKHEIKRLAVIVKRLEVPCNHAWGFRPSLRRGQFVHRSVYLSKRERVSAISLDVLSLHLSIGHGSNLRLRTAEEIDRQDDTSGD